MYIFIRLANQAILDKEKHKYYFLIDIQRFKYRCVQFVDKLRLLVTREGLACVCHKHRKLLFQNHISYFYAGTSK